MSAELVCAPEGHGMKLYVWRNVLRDYTSGMAVAVAESVNEARGVLAADPLPYWGNDLAAEPEVYELDKPVCAWCYGGG